MKHWTRNLTDAGKTILYHASGQENILLTIQRMQDEIEKMRKDYEQNEERILNIVSSEWTPEEITSAKG